MVVKSIKSSVLLNWHILKHLNIQSIQIKKQIFGKLNCKKEYGLDKSTQMNTVYSIETTGLNVCIMRINQCPHTVETLSVMLFKYRHKLL